MEMSFVDVDEVRENGENFIKVTSVTVMQHTVSFPAIMSAKGIPKDLLIKEVHTVLTAYLDKSIEISEE